MHQSHIYAKSGLGIRQSLLTLPHILGFPVAVRYGIWMETSTGKHSDFEQSFAELWLLLFLPDVACPPGQEHHLAAVAVAAEEL